MRELDAWEYVTLMWSWLVSLGLYAWGEIRSRRARRERDAAWAAHARLADTTITASHKGAIIMGPLDLGTLVRIHRYAYAAGEPGAFIEVPHVNGGTVRLTLSAPAQTPDMVQSPTNNP